MFIEQLLFIPFIVNTPSICQIKIIISAPLKIWGLMMLIINGKVYDVKLSKE
jgi:hypothetical protein